LGLFRRDRVRQLSLSRVRLVIPRPANAGLALFRKNGVRQSAEPTAWLLRKIDEKKCRSSACQVNRSGQGKIYKLLAMMPATAAGRVPAAST
jgi:hypothetical protein